MSLCLPAHAGYWKVRLDGKGSSSSNFSGATEGHRANGSWRSVTGNVFDSSIDGHGGATPPHPSNGLTITATATGSVTAVLTWEPAQGKSLKQDPAPAEVQVWEVSGAGCTYTWMGDGWIEGPRNLQCAGSDTPPTTNGGISVGGVLHSTIKNPKRSAELHLPTRSLSASGSLSRPGFWEASGGYVHVGVSYTVGFSEVFGSVRLMMYREKEDGELESLYSRNDSGTPQRPSIAGDVWVGVEVQVGPHARLDPELEAVTIRVKKEQDPDLGADQLPDEEDHIDVLLPLSPGATGDEDDYKWQKKIGFPLDGYLGDLGWSDTTEPFSTPIDENGATYRALWRWNTSEVIKIDPNLTWGLNGNYQLSVLDPVSDLPLLADLFAAQSDLDLNSIILPSPKNKLCAVNNFDVDLDADNSTFNPIKYPLSSKKDRSFAEEKIEKTKAMRIPTNMRDPDGNAVPGFADGFSIGSSGSPKCAFNFYVLIIEIPKEDLGDTGDFVFRYDGSDPADVQEVTVDDSVEYVVPENKFIRLWKKDGPEGRNGSSLTNGGDYIASGETISKQQLGFTGGSRQVRLYIEGVRDSDFESTEPIVVEYYPSGVANSKNVQKQKVFVHTFSVEAGNFGLDEGGIANEE